MTSDLAHVFVKWDKTIYYCIFCNLMGESNTMVGIICPKRKGDSLFEFFADAYRCMVCDTYCEGHDECLSHFEKVHGNWRKFKS